MKTKNPDLNDRDQVLAGAIGMTNEAGEVLGVVKKWAFQGHPLNRSKIMEEIGDTLWYMALLAEQLGTNLDAIAQSNIAKLRIRYGEEFSVAGSVERLTPER